jgi:hypothetical protein
VGRVWRGDVHRLLRRNRLAVDRPFLYGDGMSKIEDSFWIEVFEGRRICGEQWR